MQLRSNGVEVTTGILEKVGLELNEVFFKFIQKKMPFVHLKMAQTLDGRVATSKGESKYITGTESLARVHFLRQKYDGVLVGKNTLALDNPSLTNRSTEFTSISHPRRIGIGTLKNVNLDWKIFNDEFRKNTLFISTDKEIKTYPHIVDFLHNQDVALLAVSENWEGQVDLKEMLKKIADLNITSILLEGGPILASQFLKENLVDKVSLFISPSFMGSGVNVLNNLGVKTLDQKINLLDKKVEMLGPDILVEGYLCSPV